VRPSRYQSELVSPHMLFRYRNLRHRCHRMRSASTHHGSCWQGLRCSQPDKGFGRQGSKSSDQTKHSLLPSFNIIFGAALIERCRAKKMSCGVPHERHGAVARGKFGANLAPFVTVLPWVRDGSKDVEHGGTNMRSCPSLGRPSTEPLVQQNGLV
jgi:hypothetical protein